MTGTRFLRRISRRCRLTRTALKELPHEDGCHRFPLSPGTDLYGLRAERISQLHPPAAAAESAGHSVFRLRQRIAFRRVLLRDSTARWDTVAFGLLRAA